MYKSPLLRRRKPLEQRITEAEQEVKKLKFFCRCLRRQGELPASPILRKGYQDLAKADVKLGNLLLKKMNHRLRERK